MWFKTYHYIQWNQTNNTSMDKFIETVQNATSSMLVNDKSNSTVSSDKHWGIYVCHYFFAAFLGFLAAFFFPFSVKMIKHRKYTSTAFQNPVNTHFFPHHWRHHINYHTIQDKIYTTCWNKLFHTNAFQKEFGSDHYKSSWILHSQHIKCKFLDPSPK